MRIALGHQMRVGKDTFFDRVNFQYSAVKLNFAKGVYDVCSTIQQKLGKPVVKDRKLLQFIGEGMRQHYGGDIWVNQLAKEYENLTFDKDQIVIITDLRLPEEMQWVKDNGFTTIKITRKNRIVENPNHISETALADAKFDYEIENDGTLEEFYQKIDNLIAQLKK